MLSNRFGPFDLDAAADDDNHLCERYNTVADGNPSRAKWLGRVWVNPPFGDIGPWVKKAAAHSETVVMLTLANISSPWFLAAVRHAGLFLPNRRIHFWHPGRPPGSPDRDTAIFVFGAGLEFTVRPIEIHAHANEVRRLWAEASGQALLPMGLLR